MVNHLGFTIFHVRTLSSVGLERYLDTVEVSGSNPLESTLTYKETPYK